MSNINRINGLNIDAATAGYVAAINVDGPLGYNSVISASMSLTASYISPTFISASAAASGFGTGGGSATASVALSASVSQTTSTGYRVVLADLSGDSTYNTALHIDHNGITYDADTNTLTVGQLSAVGLTGSFAGTIANATSASYAATASYSTTLGADITNPVAGMLRLRNSNSTTISTITDLTASLSTTALTASSVSTLNQNVTINGNLTVFGTASYSYVSASQLNVGTNTISVNVAEPAQRFGGLVVYDSGSLSHQATASLFWDSLNNKWIYQNASGSTYSGGMLISGPRNTGAIGEEVGTTSNALMKGQGGDHITSSGIFDDGTNVYTTRDVQITGSFVVNTGGINTIDTYTGVSMRIQGGDVYTISSPNLTYINADGTANYLQLGDSFGDVNGTVINVDVDNELIAINANNGIQLGGPVNITGTLTASQFQGTASYATQALTASYALSSPGGGSTPTSSLLVTASVSLNTITFTKGDGSTFPITVNTGSGGGGGGLTFQQVQMIAFLGS